jgi:hypothetical protein
MDEMCTQIFEMDGVISNLNEALSISKERTISMENTIRFLLKRQHRGGIRAFDELVDLFSCLNTGMACITLSTIRKLILIHNKPKVVMLNIMLNIMTSCDGVSCICLDTRTVIYSRFKTLVACSIDDLGADVFDIIQPFVNRLHKDFQHGEILEHLELFVDVLNSLKSKLEVIESVQKAIKIYNTKFT